jgi:hypothetical protein
MSFASRRGREMASVVLAVQRDSGAIAVAQGAQRDDRGLATTRNPVNVAILPMTRHGHIFLSYAKLDSDFALKLAADLKKGGVTLWVDQLDIQAGDDWILRLQHALDTSVAVITVVSPDYGNSKYCR